MRLGQKLIPRTVRSRLAALYMERQHDRRVRRADVLLISFAKSGRTWLRVMLGRAIAEHNGIDMHDILNLEGIATLEPSLPIIVETHDGGTVKASPADIELSKVRYCEQKVLFMARDPRDIVVSAFFQASKRKHVFDGTLSEYLRHPIGSLDTILAYYNGWAQERCIPKEFHLVRYEDLHEDPYGQLERSLSFLGLSGVGQEVINEAVEFASFDNMRRLEVEGNMSRGGIALRPGDANDMESYKTRRGKVGGYRDYLSSSDIEYLERKVSSELDPYYRY